MRLPSKNDAEVHASAVGVIDERYAEENGRSGAVENGARGREKEMAERRKR